MPEEIVIEEKPAVVEATAQPKLVSAGKPVAFNPNGPAPQKETPPVGSNAATEAAAATTETTAPVITDEQLKTYLESQGIKYEGIDKLKEKVNYEAPAVTTELTEEQKTEAARAEEKRMLDFYIQNGGTADQFVAIKNLLSSDLTQLSVQDIKADMKKEGFDDEEIETVLKERYYQINTEELEQGENETDEDFAKRKASIEKKVAYGAKKVASRGSIIKTKAESFFTGLKDALKSEDLLKQEEVQLASNVDEALKNLPRKMTFQLGKYDDKDIAPVDHEVSEESITAVSALLKDPVQRKQFLFNADDSLNVTKLAEVLVRNHELERAIKGALLEGGTRQVAELEKVFPSTAQALGVGGNNGSVQGQKGKIVSAGKPIQFKPSRR